MSFGVKVKVELKEVIEKLLFTRFRLRFEFMFITCLVIVVVVMVLEV